MSQPSAKIEKAPLKTNLLRKIMNSFRSSNSSHKSAGMVEFIGMLKVKVVKGTNLAIRDMLLSEPYVVLNLGKQRIYDHDTFSADDIMGEAEVDLQPMITSAMAFRDAGMFGDMQIYKWLKSRDNPLEDSGVNIVDGKVKQAVSPRLQNVESGDLNLELEWMLFEQ